MNLSKTDASMVLDRDGKNISDKIGNLNKKVSSISLGVGIIPEQFPKLTGEVDETLMVQRAIDSIPEGGKITLTKIYNITTVNIKSNINIEGKGQEVSGFKSTANVIVNVLNGSVRWNLSNLGIWGSVTTSIGINLAGGSRGIADFSIRNLYIKTCLVGMKTYFSWAFTVDRVRFQDCITGIVMESQSNQGNFLACSFKVKSKLADIINCSAINFIGCEFAGNNHDGSIPISLYQSTAINFNGNYVEHFAPNIPLFEIGTVTSTTCKAISITGNYISHATSGEMVRLYTVGGLNISNNYISKFTIGYLIEDKVGNAKGIVMKGNDGYEVERNLTNFIPNYGFFAWTGGEDAFPDEMVATSSSVTGARGSDGSLQIVTTVDTQGFSCLVNESNIAYGTLEIEVKSSIDVVVYIDLLADSVYSNVGIPLKAGVYTKVSLIKYLKATSLTALRIRFSKIGTHNIKSIRMYRGVVELERDKSPALISSNKPSHGTFKRGQISTNPSPSANGYLGWICVEDGTPGTWKGHGRIEA
ncbi:hypothetical protein [Peribacillus sp. ACCC06369]|uniref:hypothetical protein n=1 Tax=Peribacillus sp. ACCC06369 TaxID=3055860 RepID=UPI0025A2C2E4|nr:hypothetical protein [Peribacillus sp. ACCC06369]MDM5359883.1 hypothetical protein [Peribacillus sp. ACCC06369]